MVCVWARLKKHSLLSLCVKSAPQSENTTNLSCFDSNFFGWLLGPSSFPTPLTIQGNAHRMSFIKANQYFRIFQTSIDESNEISMNTPLKNQINTSGNLIFFLHLLDLFLWTTKPLLRVHYSRQRLFNISIFNFQ